MASASSPTREAHVLFIQSSFRQDAAVTRVKERPGFPTSRRGDRSRALKHNFGELNGRLLADVEPD